MDHLSLLYRRHPHNMTAHKNLRQLGLVRVYRKRRDRIEQGLCKPRPTPLGLMRDYLGESPAAYDEWAGANPWMQPYLAVICPGGNMEQNISVIIPVYNGRKYLHEAMPAFSSRSARRRKSWLSMMDGGNQSAAIAGGVRNVSPGYQAGTSRRRGGP